MPSAAAAAPALPDGTRSPARAAGGDAEAPAALANAGQQVVGAADSDMAPINELEDGPAPADARSRGGGRGRGGQGAQGIGRKGRGAGAGEAGALPDAVLSAVRGGFDSCIVASPGSA